MNRMDICFILVRPSFLGNIGSTARVLKNFGFSNLRLVAPPKNYKDAEARKMSLGAFDLLKNADIFETLSDALKDVNYAIGSSCGTQREIKSISTIELPSLVEEIWTQSKRTAFIFGEERNGLTKEELNRCDLITSIPTDPDFPSLNVAQAIGVVAYELRKLSLRSERAMECSDGSAGFLPAPSGSPPRTDGGKPASNASNASRRDEPSPPSIEAQSSEKLSISASNSFTSRGSGASSSDSACSDESAGFQLGPNCSPSGTDGFPRTSNAAKQYEPVPTSLQVQSSEELLSTSLSNDFTTGKIDDELFQQLDLLLHEVGFSRSFNRESVLSELRRLYQRAKPSERESGMLHGMIRKINSKLNFEKS